MGERLVDLVEDVGLGISREQLAPKPAAKEEDKDGNHGTNSEENRK
jgi:hypothetical protein